jgi:hypothetical protein
VGRITANSVTTRSTRRIEVMGNVQRVTIFEPVRKQWVIATMTLRVPVTRSDQLVDEALRAADPHESADHHDGALGNHGHRLLERDSFFHGAKTVPLASPKPSRTAPSRSQ